MVVFIVGGIIAVLWVILKARQLLGFARSPPTYLIVIATNKRCLASLHCGYRLLHYQSNAQGRTSRYGVVPDTHCISLLTSKSSLTQVVYHPMDPNFAFSSGFK